MRVFPAKHLNRVFLVLCSMAVLGVALFLLRDPGTVRIEVNPGDEGYHTEAVIRERENNRSLRITEFRNEEGDRILFLPAFAEGMSYRIVSPAGNGALLPEDRTGRIGTGQTLPLADGSRLLILTGAPIPSLHLSLSDGLAYLEADEDHLRETDGHALLLGGDGTIRYEGGLPRMTGRGNSSWDVEKKSYNIRLEREIVPDGFAAGTDRFALISAYFDGTHLKNRLSAHFAGVCGGASVSAVHVDLYIDGEYRGLYELSARVRPQTLGITDEEEALAQLNRGAAEPVQEMSEEMQEDWMDQPRGKWWHYRTDPGTEDMAFIVEANDTIRYLENASGYITDRGSYFSFQSPERAGEGQHAFIAFFLQTCENLIAEDAAEGSCARMETLMDVDSFAVKYLVEELSKNIDTNVTSQFFYRDRAGRLYAGPVWDFDNAYGVEAERDGIDYSLPEGTVADFPSGHFLWWQMLYHNPAFFERLTEIYRQKLLPETERIAETTLDLWADALEQSAVMNLYRWDGTPASPEEAKALYRERVDRVKRFLSERTAYLSGILITE